MLCFNESGSGWVAVTRAYQRRGAIIKMRSKEQRSAGPPELMGTVLCNSRPTPSVYSSA
jgi:hypothetical protein